MDTGAEYDSAGTRHRYLYIYVLIFVHAVPINSSVYVMNIACIQHLILLFTIFPDDICLSALLLLSEAHSL